MDVMTEAQVWNLIFENPELEDGQEGALTGQEGWGRPQDPARPAGDPRSAKLGIVWVDSHADISYEISINGVPIAPPHRARGGRVVREIPLPPGSNRLDLAIDHNGRDCQHAVYLKLGESVRKVREDCCRSESRACAPSTVIVETP